MLYLSQLLGSSVEDLQGERVGKITDMLIAQDSAAATAYSSTLLIEDEEDQHWRVAVEDVERYGKGDQHSRFGVRLRIPQAQLLRQSVPPPPHEVSLAQEVLDKQVIDVERRKAVRVNDVCLDDDWRVLGVDNSTLGLVRRLAPNWLLGTNSKRTTTNLIAWAHIELIGLHHLDDGSARAAPPEGANIQGEPSPALQVQQRPQSGQLAELRPADIADIVHQLTPGQGARLIEGLDNETAADALEEIDTGRQSQILEMLRAERAADILEAMGPDEAADLLAMLPEERAQELLRLMTPEESEGVQDLLEYEEDTAGGLMTTDYIALNLDKSAADALAAVRSIIREHDIYPAYIYCVADETQDESKLLGVVSLWELLVASPTQELQDIMEADLVMVQPDTDPRTVAEVMAKYNLLAVPVVGVAGILEGIVTVDDALDVLLPAERRRKPTRMY